MTNSAEEHTAPAPAPAPQPMPVPGPALVPAMNDPRRKRPLLACVLSAMPGLGQVYVGYYKRGFVHAIVVALLISLLVAEVTPLIPLASIFLAFFYLYNIVDAGRRAALYNQALAGGREIELPDDLGTPGLGGSVVGGSLLILLGLVLLSHTAFGVSLEWLEAWWPVAVIGFGAYLLVKALQERAGGDAGSDA